MKSFFLYYTLSSFQVHRTIVSACTSLVSEPHAVERGEEFAMPPELNYASVEPVIR